MFRPCIVAWRIGRAGQDSAANRHVADRGLELAGLAAVPRRPLGGRRRPVPDRDDRHGRHGPAHGRQHHPRGQVRRQHPPGGRLPHGRVQPNGLIGDPNAPNQGLGYLYGHGFSILFLSQLYGEEEEPDRRAQARGHPEPGGRSSPATRQTSRGGWGYLSAREGNDFDEGSVSDHPGAGPAGRPQRRHRRAQADHRQGARIPAEMHDRPRRPHLQPAQRRRPPSGRRSPWPPSPRCSAPASTPPTLAKRWLKFVQPQVPVNSVGADQFGHSEYTHYYYAQVIYMPGRGRLRQNVPRVEAGRAA